MADEPKLVVALEARLDRFERQLREAGLIAEREMKSIEGKMSLATTAGNLISKAIESAFTAFVDKLKQTIELMKDLNDVAKVTAVSFEQIQRIGFAGALGGLSQKEVLSDLDKLALNLDDMNRKQTGFSALLEANNLKFKQANGLVVDVNRGLELTAILMGRAGSEAEKIRIAEMAGLSRKWVDVLGEGVDKFREMQGQAKIDENLARAAQHMRAIVDMQRQLTAESQSWSNQLTQLILPAASAVETKVAEIVRMMADRQPADSVLKGILEREAAILERRAAIMKKALDEANAPLKITVNKPSGVKFPKEGDAEKNALVKQNEQLSKTIALSQAELDMVGQTVAKQEEARQIALLTEAAKRAGLEADTAVTEEMRKQAAVAGQLKQAVAERNAQFNELTSLSREFGQTMSQAMQELVLQGKSFDAVLKNILNRVASKAFDKLFDIMFASPAGGGSSPFLKLFGLQHGGPASAGQPYIVGERGPELFVPNRNGVVVPNTALARAAAASSITGGSTSITVQGNADQATIATMAAMLAQRDRRFVADVAKANLELRRRSVFA